MAAVFLTQIPLQARLAVPAAVPDDAEVIKAIEEPWAKPFTKDEGGSLWFDRGAGVRDMRWLRV